MDVAQTIVLVLLMLISGALPFLEARLHKRNTKIKIECLLTANEHDWISAEEIALLVGTSVRGVKRNLEWAIKERIIVGNLENNMFERITKRSHNDIASLIPEKQWEI
ncbi:MAG: hypothetical protein RTU63_08750 [Candidatus Thorarchaeota archaeon]